MQLRYSIKRNTTMKKGFTLIELLVVIAIIATILGVALPNFIGARERARDTKRKAEMGQVKSALRLYYNDYQRYPANYTGGGKINYIQGCGATGTSNCPGAGSCSTLDFAAGGAGCSIIYMSKLPAEMGSSMYYYQRASGNNFCLKIPLDNASDSDIAASQARCASVCTGLYSASDYVVCAD